jgi:hypothetical protein
MPRTDRGEPALHSPASLTGAARPARASSASLGQLRQARASLPTGHSLREGSRSKSPSGLFERVSGPKVGSVVPSGRGWSIWSLGLGVVIAPVDPVDNVLSRRSGRLERCGGQVDRGWGQLGRPVDNRGPSTSSAVASARCPPSSAPRPQRSTTVSTAAGTIDHPCGTHRLSTGCGDCGQPGDGRSWQHGPGVARARKSSSTSCGQRLWTEVWTTGLGTCRESRGGSAGAAPLSERPCG